MKRSKTESAPETTNSPLDRIRSRLSEKECQAYFVSVSDEHLNEMVRERDNFVRFLSGFTGSMGFLFVTRSGPGFILVDSRYHIQAAQEVRSEEWSVVKLEEIEKFFEDKGGWKVLFEAQITSLRTQKRLSEKFAAFEPDRFLAANFGPFEEEETFFNPKNPLYALFEQNRKLFGLSEAVTGRSAASKLTEVRTVLGDSVNVVADLAQVAWLTNLRGFDYTTTPTFDSFLVVAPESATLFVRKSALDQQVRESLAGNGITFREYSEFYGSLAELRGKKVVLQPSTVNFALVAALQGVATVEEKDFLDLLVARKNATEIANVRRIHKRDSLRFLRLWQLFEAGQADTEYELAMLMERVRCEDEHYFSPSYTSIVGAGANGAIVHYNPPKRGSAGLFDAEGKGRLVLIDSGGQYSDGATTDVTRVFLSGEPTEAFKRDYTNVLKGHIAALLPGVTFEAAKAAEQIDALARKTEYGHGTGHGIGAFLNVHESPVGTYKGFVFEPNMVTSIEPGVYVEGSHGIRLENGVVAVDAKEGNLSFETLTWVPYERDLIDVSALEPEELEYVNWYHDQIVQLADQLAFYDEGFKEFVRKKCEPLKRTETV